MRIAFSYHLVTNSPWPLTAAFSIFSLLIGNILSFQNKIGGFELIILSTLSLIYSSTLWLKDIIIEGTYKGEHTEKVQQGLNLGFILFVVSEVCVFVGLFFAYFYNALVPAIEVGGLWPPIGITTLDYKAVPLLNTLILLTSGFSITACHNYIINKNYSKSFFYLLITILLGLIFMYFQYFEYFHSFFTISDSVFGSSFFILTGCHGMHIIVGTTFLFFTLLRLAFSHFSNHHHLQFSAAAIYWHFLDAVWLILYFVLYCWSA
ncbi:cytochrome c oxidase subunit 3 (mitochondrion) [Paramicrosporidium saccamoebae]|uniref:Cytochrome c oxidase subunit 3 n=1 Tax=Paramicrosporidium saccamoebae TaxID=1246581 RepID=A0A2H9TR13_9FUNG|nr:cytochrome c oxidase subunit 3 [Paramicrosporidium saccamoebae]